jgi:hypothetical protein
VAGYMSDTTVLSRENSGDFINYKDWGKKGDVKMDLKETN